MSAADKKRKYAEAVAGIALLQDVFPKAFFLPERKRLPLKTGIRDDVAAAGFSAATPAELAAALRVYTHKVDYLDRLRPGAVRIGLDGEPAGVVTADEAAHAAEQFAALLQKRARRAQAKNGQPVPVNSGVAPDPARPARLSLKDLRASAQLRKIAAA